MRILVGGSSKYPLYLLCGLMKHNYLSLHKLSDTENINKFVPLFLNATEVQGDTLLRLVVTFRKKKTSAIYKNLSTLQKS